MTLKSSKHRRLCHEFLKDHNMYAAARRTGYSEASARAYVCTLFARPDFKAYLKELISKQEFDTKVDAKRVLDELARLAFHDVGNYYKPGPGKYFILKSLDEMTPDQRAAIAEYNQAEGKLKLHSKDGALDKLGKHLKLFSDLDTAVTNFMLLPEMKLGGKTLIFNVGKPSPKGAASVTVKQK